MCYILVIYNYQYLITNQKLLIHWFHHVSVSYPSLCLSLELTFVHPAPISCLKLCLTTCLGHGPQVTGCKTSASVAPACSCQDRARNLLWLLSARPDGQGEWPTFCLCYIVSIICQLVCPYDNWSISLTIGLSVWQLLCQSENWFVSLEIICQSKSWLLNLTFGL